MRRDTLALAVSVFSLLIAGVGAYNGYVANQINEQALRKSGEDVVVNFWIEPEEQISLRLNAPYLHQVGVPAKFLLTNVGHRATSVVDLALVGGSGDNRHVSYVPDTIEIKTLEDRSIRLPFVLEPGVTQSFKMVGMISFAEAIQVHAKKYFEDCNSRTLNGLAGYVNAKVGRTLSGVEFDSFRPRFYPPTGCPDHPGYEDCGFGGIQLGVAIVTPEAGLYQDSKGLMSHSCTFSG